MRALLFILFAVAGVGLSLVLGGCASPELLRTTGEKVDAPFGFQVGCAANPDAVLCPKKAELK